MSATLEARKPAKAARKRSAPTRAKGDLAELKRQCALANAQDRRDPSWKTLICFPPE